MDGILVVDKIAGLTSHDVVDSIRKRFGLKKVGHAGTLDPLATGVLVILIGAFTKRAKEFINHDKEYLGCLTLGVATDSQDAHGKILQQLAQLPNYTIDQIRAVFCQFLGSIEQTPPMFSALKYRGRRLYALAREGKDVVRKKRKIHIYKLELIRLTCPHIYFLVSCSKGTYVRTLCADIAEQLGCVGHLSQLRRIKSGPFALQQAVDFNRLHSLSPEALEAILIKDFTDEADYRHTQIKAQIT